MEPLDAWLAMLIGAFAYALVWALAWSVPALLLRRNDMADIAWGPTFPFLALVLGGAVVALDPGNEPRAALAVGLALAWGLRLGIHIGRRWVSHDTEDKRYATWREQWGDRWVLRSILQVFVLQAVLVAVIGQPLFITVTVPDADVALGLLDALAVVLVVGGVILEATADRQLARFIARKQAGEEQLRYLTTGVWSWSRHPNYAGDAIAWWGFGLFGVAAALDADATWLAIPSIIGPIVMTWFLRYGSGVALSERGRAGHPQWDAYVERTSAFLPRPPK